MIRDHVCFGSIDWGYLWQGPQELMARYARAGGHVVYVNHAGIRRPYLADWVRILRRLRDWAASPRGRGIVGLPEVTVISPIVLPFPWSQTARRINRALFARGFPSVLKAKGLHAPIAWSFVPTPFAIDALRELRSTRSLSVYYCVADFAAVADRPAAMRASEDEMLSEIDLVLAGGRVLQRRLAPRHASTILAPFSVGDHFFGQAATEPADLANVPHPRVIYVGGLHRHVDRPLLGAVITSLRDVQFVFVGPKVSGDWEIEALPNAHFVGRKAYADLPRYVDAARVGLVPYQLSPFTETVWPTKLHEYLARGRPVVSTALPEVELLGYPPTDLRIASTPSAFAAAIESLVSERDERAEARRDLARQYSWERTIARINAAIEAKIASR